MSDSLLRQLTALNQNHRLLKDAKGGYAVILERGSRLIRLVPANHTESAVWTDIHALEKGSWNVGGDRTWISPEMDFFRDASGNYDIPSQLDPGSYRFVPSGNAGIVRTRQTCVLTHWPEQSIVPLNLTKEYSLIANPFLMIDSNEHRELAQVPYIGYQCETRIEHLREAEHVSNAPLLYFNLWSILQVPPGGTVLVPVLGDSEPLVMYREHEEIRINRQNHYASFPFDGGNSFKLSYNTLQSAGRFGYYRKLSKETSSLIVRQFQVNPSALYPDYPEGKPDYTGSCMQFFYDGEKMGGFGELEYHAPSMNGNNLGVRSDHSQLYYFVGESGQIANIARHMLGLNIPR
ncbi:hypothetical protein SAMN02799630_00943 [Paenibacillus sp. UNCCL117]|uniref:DUF6786 family protein n=1 Tax=unclassified Paenibacillus TaxID=185978 RepID=UPI00088A0574|nr:MULTISPECIES: DUF6786 family protein [unclassified Paenibacillus]SDC26078.1 hypothetical protein SAMN04488602_101745 [Paenibacillus sp. cl123]SFW19990.1 hypothetical protein SAMN02799630_00943 [Paenibacillus sp. UNCCL117]